MKKLVEEMMVYIGYAFLAVVFVSCAWLVGSGVILVGGILHYDFDAANNTYLPFVFGIPSLALIIFIALKLEQDGWIATETEPEIKFAGLAPDRLGAGRLRQAESCPLCNRTLSPKPLNLGVGGPSDIFLNCDNNHERLSFSAMTMDWSTKSKDVAEQLTAKGYIIHREGNSYIVVDR